MATNFHNRLLKLDLKLRKELDEVLAPKELFWFQKSRKSGYNQVIEILVITMHQLLLGGLEIKLVL